MPNSRWSALHLLEWYESASLEEIYEVIDPHLYVHRPRVTAAILGCSIDVVYNLRKKCIRRKMKPRLEHFIRLLSI